jgi:hypothetical protein
MDSWARDALLDSIKVDFLVESGGYSWKSDISKNYPIFLHP